MSPVAVVNITAKEKQIRRHFLKWFVFNRQKQIEIAKLPGYLLRCGALGISALFLAFSGVLIDHFIVNVNFDHLSFAYP